MIITADNITNRLTSRRKVFLVNKFGKRITLSAINAGNPPVIGPRKCGTSERIKVIGISDATAAAMPRTVPPFAHRIVAAVDGNRALTR